MNIKIPKIRFSVKIDRKRHKDFSDIELDMYLGIIISFLFGPTSKFRESVILEGLTNGLYIEKNRFYDFSTLEIIAESEQPDILVEEIKEVLMNIQITKKDLERIKKVWIASEIRMIDSVETTVENVYSDLVMYSNIYFNRIDIIKEMNMRKLNKILKDLDLSNQSLVMILPKDE